VPAETHIETTGIVGEQLPKWAWKSEAITLAVICVLAVCALFYHLGQGTLADWDEATYAQISKEMVHSGDWMTEHYEYEVWFDKPPLLMWSIAVFFKIFGVNELWSRAPSAFAGIALLIVTYLVGKAIYGPWVGLSSVAVMLTSLEFLKIARMGMIDTMLTFFILLAVYGYLRLQSGDSRWWYLICACCGLGFMAKSLAIIVVPASIAVALMLDKRARASLQSKHFWLGTLVGLAIAAPWHILMYARHGRVFLDESLFFHASRLTAVLNQEPRGRWYYAEALRWYFYPWLYLAPFALAVSLKENLKGKNRSRILLLLIVIVFGLCSVTRTKVHWYMLPLYPPLAILIASLFIQAWRSYKSTAFAALPVAIIAVLLLAPKYLVLTLGFIGFLIFAFLHPRKPELAYRAVVIMIAAFLLLTGARTIQFLYSMEEAPVAKLARMARATTDNDREPMIVFSGINRPTALFYSDRPILITEMREGLGRAISVQRPKRVILAKRDLGSLSHQYQIHVIAEAGDFAYGTISQLPEGRSVISVCTENEIASQQRCPGL